MSPLNPSSQFDPRANLELRHHCGEFVAVPCAAWRGIGANAADLRQRTADSPNSWLSWGPRRAATALVVALALGAVGCATAPEAPTDSMVAGTDSTGDSASAKRGSDQPDVYADGVICDFGSYPPQPPPKCVAGACADGNICTQDLCDPAHGCYFPPQNEGVACSDGHVCTTGSTCSQGQCGTAAIGPIDVGAGHWAEPMAMADGGAVIIGVTDGGANQPLKAWTRRVGPAGDLLWNRDWPTGVGSGTPVKAISAPQDGVFVAGNWMLSLTSASDDSGKRPWLARLDAAGDLVWQIQAADMAGTVVAAARQGDGQVGLLVQAAKNNPGIWLLRATEAGQWLPPVELPNAVTARPVALAIESTDTLLVLAQAYHVEGGAQTIEDDVVVWRLDSSGKLLSSYAWPYVQLGSATAIAADSSGFWMAGVLRGLEWTWQPFVSRFSPGGKQQWRQVIGDSAGYSSISLALLPNGGAATLLAAYANGPIWPILSHYSSAGAVTWRGQPTATRTRPNGFAARPGGWMWCDTTLSAETPLHVRWVRATVWGQDDCAAAGACLSKEFNDCPAGDACSGPQCSPTSGCLAPGANVAPAVQCDDGNACTVETCDPLGGCNSSNAVSGSNCDDHSVCTGGDYCAAGLCVGKTTAICNDGNPCTVDTCEPHYGCEFKGLPEGSPCDDGLPCTAGGECLSGKCGAPTVWRRGLLPAETGSVAGLFAGPQDGLIAVGHSAAAGFAPRPLAIGLSAGGHELWTRAGSATPGLALHAAIQLEDGTLLAAGAAGAPNSDVALVRWLPGGTAPLVTVEASPAIDAADAITAVAQGFLLAGHRGGQAWVEQRAANGAVQWTKTVLSANVQRVGALAALPNGEWAVAIDVQTPAGGLIGSVVLRFAADGQLAWQSAPAYDVVLRAMALVGPETLTVGGRSPSVYAESYAYWHPLNSKGVTQQIVGFGEGTAVNLLGNAGAWQVAVLHKGKSAGEWQAQVYATSDLLLNTGAPKSALSLQAQVLPGGSGEQFSLRHRSDGWDVAASAGSAAPLGPYGQLFAWQVARTRPDGSANCP